MRIAIVGAGYVGLVSGTCFSEFGVDVICVDTDETKIAALQAGKIPIFEPGLDLLVAKNVAAGRLSFATDLAASLNEADAAFIAVGTPSRRGDGHADLTHVRAVARAIAAAITQRLVIVTKSTVPVGTASEIETIIIEERPELKPGRDFDVASNPEFLREGSAIEDFMRPDRVVVGADSEYARDVMSALYRPLFLRDTPILFTSRETAELTKYAANAFLATKISFINEIADLCEKVGANVQDVARGMGYDGRIGAKFLHPGPGYGGSCFPKDTLALLKTAEQFDVPSRIVQSAVDVNERRKEAMAQRIIAACGGSVEGKRIAILGVTFKPNTDDMRDAPSLAIIPALQKAGAEIVAHDPAGQEAAKVLLPGVTWVGSAYETMEGAHAITILTEWNEFRGLDLNRAMVLMQEPVMVDLRNIYDPDAMRDAGFHYVSIGRGTVGAKGEAA